MAIRFGTDGWRAEIDKDFSYENLRLLAHALGHIYTAQLEKESKSPSQHAILIAYDTRKDAKHYAHYLASILSSYQLKIELSDKVCPTPALCWNLAHRDELFAGSMFTASHNPAHYLGVKLRMQDGGASPKDFTDKIESLLKKLDPAELEARDAQQDEALIAVVDCMSAYLEALKAGVDARLLSQSKLKLVHDPLYGASQSYVAPLLREMGLEIEEIHSEQRCDFAGLHPEPIDPWIEECRQAVLESGAVAGLINDGDADRVGAIDEEGSFVSPHKILALVIEHLLRKGKTGRVVSTVSASSLLERLCEERGLELCITPVGFKWIYEQMLKGDVLVGGEESGGIGIPAHVMERDGLYMDLLLCEMMALNDKSLKDLVDDLELRYGRWYYKRLDLSLEEKLVANFRVHKDEFEIEELDGLKIIELDKRDGLYLRFEEGAWLLLRASGTEPLLRVYAEASSLEMQERLLRAAQQHILPHFESI